MYKAIVCRIHTREFPGADRLLIGQCGAYQVIVGKDTQDGQLGLFLETDGRLSEDFAKSNDLIRRKDENGNPAGGMFEENRKVKSIKLRGARSDGFWCPLSHLDYLGGDTSSLKEGDQIDSFHGVVFCEKFVTKATQARQGKNKSGTPRDNKMFAKHIDTGHFKREAHLIPEGSIIYITEKLHGTSFRLANVLDDTPIKRNPIGQLFAWLLNWPKTKKEWKILVGSRNVIIGDSHSGFHGAEEFRKQSVDGIVPRKGECIFGEIVGYSEAGAPIMATQPTAGLRDKAVLKQYGEQMEYSYGCLPGTCQTYVYRITQVNEDSFVTELPWPQVKKRCKELGLKHVPEVANGPYIHENNNQHSLDYLSKTVQSWCERTNGDPLPSLLDARHIREGVVVRAESEHGTMWLKEKGFCFRLLEGICKESDDFVDTEEAA